jgi:hypothetical protein
LSRTHRSSSRRRSGTSMLGSHIGGAICCMVRRGLGRVRFSFRLLLWCADGVFSFDDIRSCMFSSCFIFFFTAHDTHLHRQANSVSRSTLSPSHPACKSPIPSLSFPSHNTNTPNPTHSVDDSFLQKAASSLPQNSILLIEDIDCAFPVPRSDDDDDNDNDPSSNMNPYDIGMGMVTPSYLPGGARRRSAVTLSGLLNVLDGVGSEEGKLFFATVSMAAVSFGGMNVRADDHVGMCRRIILTDWIRRC